MFFLKRFVLRLVLKTMLRAAVKMSRKVPLYLRSVMVKLGRKIPTYPSVALRVVFLVLPCLLQR